MALRKLLSNFSYTVISNFITLFVSVILLLVIPKQISITEYGYWQLYIFYISYIAYAAFGLSEGVYLKYGGESYDNLPKKVLRLQFWLLVVFLSVFLSAIYFIFSVPKTASFTDENFVLLFACIVGLVIVPRGYLALLLQATNRVKSFVFINIIEKILYFFCVLVVLTLDLASFEIIILIDLLAKIIAQIYCVCICRQLVIGRVSFVSGWLAELQNNFSSGIKLAFSNLAGMLIIGIIRFFIIDGWSIETFGKVSLTLSIFGLFMVFINSASIVFFPFLKTYKKDVLINIYPNVRVLLMTFMPWILLSYFFISLILNWWLPQYKESLDYMILLFPMIIFESKTLLLLNTYLKVMRKEALMFRVNLYLVLGSFVVSIIFSYVFQNLHMLILFITILLAVRSTVLEIAVAQLLGQSTSPMLWLEIGYSILFISGVWLWGNLGLLLMFILVLLITLPQFLLFKKALLSIRKLG